MDVILSPVAWYGDVRSMRKSFRTHSYQSSLEDICTWMCEHWLAHMSLHFHMVSFGMGCQWESGIVGPCNPMNNGRHSPLCCHGCLAGKCLHSSKDLAGKDWKTDKPSPNICQDTLKKYHRSGKQWPKWLLDNFYKIHIVNGWYEHS